MEPNYNKPVKRCIGIIITMMTAVFFASCGTSPTDMRSLVSADTLIYLESNDLFQALKLITENERFLKDSSTVPDLSALEGVQIAIAISGFEASENEVTKERSVLNLKPAFVAVAETHGWSWQVNGLVEGAVSDFVKKTYGGDAKLERRSMTNSEWYIWTANDGRKSYAAIAGTRVYFGNNKDVLERSLAAGRGDSDSLLSNKALDLEYRRSIGKLAFGFVSGEGIKKIADLAGVSVAVEKTEDENARGFISRILPQVLNNSIKEIVWTAEKKKNGVEDHIYVKTAQETSEVLSETLVSGSKRNVRTPNFLPPETRQVTQYDLKNPQVAFRSVILVTAKSVSDLDARLIAGFSNSLLEPYGILNAEVFLSAVGPQILTAQLDEDGDNSFAVVEIKDIEKIRTAVSDQLRLAGAFENVGDVKLWKAVDEDLSAAEIDGYLIIGNSDAVSKAISTWTQKKISPSEPANDFTKSSTFGIFSKSPAVSVTFGRGTEDIGRLVRVFGEPKQNDERSYSNTLVETRFTKTGIERKYTSEFGFIGTIVSQFEGQ